MKGASDVLVSDADEALGVWGGCWAGGGCICGGINEGLNFSVVWGASPTDYGCWRIVILKRE